MNLDESVAELITRIKRTYKLILENKSPSKINAAKDVLLEIAQVMQECAQFITKYSETASFCTSITPVFPERSSSFHRASTRQERIFRDSHHGYQLQFEARHADAGAP